MDVYVVTVDGVIVYGPTTEIEAYNRKRLLRSKGATKVKVRKWTSLPESSETTS